MISYTDCKPTGSQKIKDESFIRSVKEDLRPALLRDLEALFPNATSFDGATVNERIERLKDSNRNEHGRGDSLTIRHGFNSFEAYAGLVISPLLFLEEAHRPEEILASDDDSLTGYCGESRLRRYIYGRLELADSDESANLPLYQDLPIAYRAALVCEYVGRHVIARSEDVTEFVLGVTDELESFRFTAKPTRDALGQINGWSVRIRDVRPSQNLGKHIADYLKSTVANAEKRDAAVADEIRKARLEAIRQTRAEGGDFAPEEARLIVEHNLVDQFEIQPVQRKRAKRAGSVRTETMVAFVDRYIEEHHGIGRRSEESWDDAAGALAKETGLVYTGKNLRDCYNSYKKRHGRR